MVSLAVVDPTPDTFIQFVLPAVIGALAGVIGGLITAGAMLVNGKWQREHATLGVRREIDSRLIEFAEQVAQLRAWGFGELAAMQSTFDRLDGLMEAEKGGPAALSSDELTRDVYSMLKTARRNISTLDRTISNDRSVEDQLTGAQLHDWRERCQVNYSAILSLTSGALIKIFERTDESEPKKKLDDASAQFSKRMKDYTARADAAREAMLRAVLAARVTAENPTDVGTP